MRRCRWLGRPLTRSSSLSNSPPSKSISTRSRTQSASRLTWSIRCKVRWTSRHGFPLVPVVADRRHIGLEGIELANVLLQRLVHLENADPEVLADRQWLVPRAAALVAPLTSTGERDSQFAHAPHQLVRQGQLRGPLTDRTHQSPVGRHAQDAAGRQDRDHQGEHRDAQQQLVPDGATREQSDLLVAIAKTVADARLLPARDNRASRGRSVPARVGFEQGRMGRRVRP